MILEGLDVFTEVVDAGSFSAAARRLGMPVSTVSAKVARLEDRLGVTLLHRTTRQLSLTQIGARYYQRCTHALSEIADAERALDDEAEEPAGLLRIAAAADMVRFKLVPLVEAYLARHPKTAVELLIENRSVDLVADGIDLAIRPGPQPDSTLVARRFAETFFGLYAAEAYLERRGIPTEISDLARHDIVRMSRAGDLLQLQDPSGGGVVLSGQSRLGCDDVQGVRAFVETGAGIGLLPDFVAEIPGAPLVRVLPELSSATVPAYFVYPAQRFVPPNLRAFIDLALAREAARMPATPPGA